MKKVIIYWFCLLAILLWMTSCKSTQPVVLEKTIETTHTIVERDTVFTIAADTISYQALLECRNGKVVLVKSDGRLSQDRLSQKVSIKDNVLTIDCIKKIQELKAKIREKNTSHIITKPVAVYVPANITSWQWFQIWCGRLLLIGLIILLIGFLFKKYKP